MDVEFLYCQTDIRIKGPDYPDWPFSIDKMDGEKVQAIETRVDAAEARLRGLESVVRVVQDLRKRQVYSARLQRAPHDYYDWVLADRAYGIQRAVLS